MKRILAITIAVVLLVAMVLPSTVFAAKPGVLRVPQDYATIQEAVDAASPGDTIRVGPGEYAGATINNPVVIEGIGCAMITSGVPYKAGASLETAFLLEAGADGTEISHLIIPNDAASLYFFAVFSRYVDDVSLHHLTITNSVQAISNYNGSGWNISHNKITGTLPDGGGGIGIMINAWDGTWDSSPDDTEANDNIIAHNYTEGIVGDVGYSGPGILLSSGHGAGGEPGGTLTGNIVYKNKCSHTGENGVGFEVDDVPYELTNVAAITGNTVAYNDFRGSTTPILWYGDESQNDVSRNLGTPGDNRGEGKEGLTPPEIFD